MAYSDRSDPDAGMIGAAQELGRSLWTDIIGSAIEARDLRDLVVVSVEDHPFGIYSARHPLLPLAALYNACERVEAGLKAEFAPSGGKPGNRPDHDLHDFLAEIVVNYRDIVMTARLSAAPSKAGRGLQSSPLGRFVDSIFDLMEEPNREHIPLPAGWRPSASTLRQVVDRLNDRGEG